MHQTVQNTSRSTNMVAEEVTTTDQLVEKTVEVPKEKDAFEVAQEIDGSTGKNVKVIPQERMWERTVLARTR